MLKLIYFSPRILSLLFVGFISLFSLDVFGEYQGPNLITAFFMHLIPTIVLLVFIVIAWKFGLIGAIAFIGFSIFYAFQAINHPAWVVLLSGSSLVVGLLYFWDWYKRKKSTI